MVNDHFYFWEEEIALSNENSSYLRFTVEESIWFQKGHEVEELVSISLSPDVVIQETRDYVLIRGALELTGEYQSKSTTENEQEFVGTNEKFMEILEVKENGSCFFRYYFPVDITIRREKIVSVHQVDFLVDHFDYHFPERSCLKLTAHLLVTGLMEEAPVKQEWQNVSQPSIFTPAARAKKESIQKVKEVVVNELERDQLLASNQTVNEEVQPQETFSHTQASKLEELIRLQEEVSEETVVQEDESVREEVVETISTYEEVPVEELETSERYLDEDIVIDGYFEEEVDEVEIEVVFEEERIEESIEQESMEEDVLVAHLDEVVEGQLELFDLEEERYEENVHTSQELEDDYTYEEEVQTLEENYNYEEEVPTLEEDYNYEEVEILEDNIPYEELIQEDEVEEVFPEDGDHLFKQIKVEAIPVYEETHPPIVEIVPQKIIPFVINQRKDEVVEEVQEAKATAEAPSEEKPVPTNKSRFGFDLFFSSKNKKEVEEKAKEEPKTKEVKKETTTANKMKLTEFFSSKSEETNANLKLYFIQPKDTLESIAHKYNTSVNSLLKYNKLDSPSTLVAGEILYVPNVKVSK